MAGGPESIRTIRKSWWMCVVVWSTSAVAFVSTTSLGDVVTGSYPASTPLATAQSREPLATGWRATNAPSLRLQPIIHAAEAIKIQRAIPLECVHCIVWLLSDPQHRMRPCRQAISGQHHARLRFQLRQWFHATGHAAAVVSRSSGQGRDAITGCLSRQSRPGRRPTPRSCRALAGRTRPISPAARWRTGRGDRGTAPSSRPPAANRTLDTPGTRRCDARYRDGGFRRTAQRRPSSRATDGTVRVLWRNRTPTSWIDCDAEYRPPTAHADHPARSRPSMPAIRATTFIGSRSSCRQVKRSTV
jgi:hypothetical protein